MLWLLGICYVGTVSAMLTLEEGWCYAYCGIEVVLALCLLWSRGSVSVMLAEEQE